jgi:hypothetical protein
MTRNSTVPAAGGVLLSTADRMTTLLPFGPVSNPVATTVYCDPAVRSTFETLKD